MVFSWSEPYFQVTFLNFLARFLSFLIFKRLATRKFDLQDPVGVAQVNLPRLPASRRSETSKIEARKFKKVTRK